jgi:hypothetical protein
VNGVRLVLAVLLTMALTMGLVVCSQLPYEPDTRETALLRLSWRATGERVEKCRQVTPEELAALPQHMRREEICEGRLAPFELSVALNGENLYTGLIRAAGARQDRPTYVSREFEVSPGTHRLSVRFVSDLEDSARAPLVFDAAITLEPRQVLLVTHDPHTDQLIIFDPAS